MCNIPFLAALKVGGQTLLSDDIAGKKKRACADSCFQSFAYHIKLFAAEGSVLRNMVMQGAVFPARRRTYVNTGTGGGGKGARWHRQAKAGKAASTDNEG